MTEKRYFYSDPRDALIMSKQGMSFVGVSGLMYPIADIAYAAYSIFSDQSPSDPVQGELFYIHPDDYHLLEPRGGDLVKATYTHGDDFIYRHITGKKPSYYEVGGFPDEYGYPDFIKGGRRKIYEIIQRSGKPFIAPEEETV